MARGRRKIGRNGDDPVKLISIKMTLYQVLLPKFRAAFINLMSRYCNIATRISFLASMLFLCKANEAVDTNNHAFFTQDGPTVIRDCFRGHNLPPIFQSMMRKLRLIWPEREGLGNAFNHSYELYTTNVKNNLKVWYVHRIRAFLRMKSFEYNHGRLRNRKPNIGIIDETDIKNTVKFLVNQRDWTHGYGDRVQKMTFLLNEVHRVGGPANNNLKEFVTVHWFRSIHMWINIQRQISHFHTSYAYLNSEWGKFKQDPCTNKQPLVPRPPKVKNFNAIPVHDYHLKHIRIDTTQFFDIARKLGALNLTKGKSGQLVCVPKHWYTQNPAYYWSYVFDMRKIQQIGGRHKTFDCSIMTDSVAVSLIYVKTDRALNEIDLKERIIQKYENNEFVYELGVDPGVRTWNATVRRRIANGTEVC